MEDYKNLNKSSKLLIVSISILLSLVLLASIVRVMFFNFVDNYELSYLFDKQTGKIELLQNPDGSLKSGYIYSKPFVQSVHTIDLRPMQICINANSRVLNCKLVRFNRNGFKQFIDIHGRDSYSQYELQEILKSYAYDEDVNLKEYKFLEILKELKDQKYNDENINTKIKDSIK